MWYIMIDVLYFIFQLLVKQSRRKVLLDMRMFYVLYQLEPTRYPKSST